MKKAHIISHTHWDREWYLPYETHHMLLVEFMDTLIETLENDKDYKSFHLDGQTIMIDDYLQVRPEMKERLTKLIQEERIHIGPWFILQDEFLTSSEANVRNLQVGHEMAKEYGKVAKVGYFPDSFGNMGQAPQILQQVGIDTAVFGRGVKPTGFNNQVGDGEAFESQYSEMYWESPDGSKVLGVLFANWYSNGNEVPQDAEEAKIYWEKRLEDAKKYASTHHLLFMNGCDHQPVQTDLSESINVANALYDDVTFVHSNFEDYIKAIKEELPENLKVIHGELRSQQTDGWYTLANTASARVYLKQMNAKCQTLFEKVAEPLAAMAYANGMAYPHHLFYYGWKLLMENHPHDSICGCSVDEVHQEMVTRFMKAEYVALHIINEARAFLSTRINVEAFKNIHEEAIPFYVANTTGWERTGVVETIVDVKRKYFREDHLKNVVNAIKEMELPNYQVVDETGKVMPATVEALPYNFDYDLPKDKFRQPYMARRVKVTFETDALPAFGWKTYALIPTQKQIVRDGSPILENNWYAASINANGSLKIVEKESGKVFDQLGIYEDHGDIGNEYIHFTPVGEAPITTKETQADVKILMNTEFKSVVEVTQTIHIPKSANEVLDQEIADIIEFKHRKAQRVEETIPMEITTQYTFTRASRVIEVKTTFDNQALDHRLRVLFETGIQTDSHYADSIFEVAKRANQVDKAWENPCNAQHQQNFINIHNDVCGLTIANKGLNEYEVLKDQVIAVTLHRGVRELGDWGIFMTPEAQCLGKQTCEFAIIVHGKDCAESYKEAYQYCVPYTTGQMIETNNTLASTSSVLKGEGEGIMWSALKVNKTTGDLVGRWYNVSDETKTLTLDTSYTCYQTNLLEEESFGEVANTLEVTKGRIVTLGFKK